MPELPQFYGIIIRMYVEAGESHQRPHFHACYQEHAAVFAIDTIEWLPSHDDDDLRKYIRLAIDAAAAS